MSEPMTFQKKSRRERYIVRDDVEGTVKIDILDSILQVLFNDSYSFLGLNKKISETNRLVILVTYYLF